MFRVDWRKFPKGTTIVEIFLIVVVLFKVALSPLDFSSAAIMLPLAAIFISKIIISEERKRASKISDEFSSRLVCLEEDVKYIEDSQKEVIRQSEETKSIISKLNLASAFGGRKRGE